MDHKKPDPIQPVSLEVGDMHGPITTKVDIYVKLPEGRVAKLQTRMAVGLIPTRAEIKSVLDAAMAPETASSIPAGTRLLTKPEFIAHILKMEGGAELPMPGDQQFVAVPGDVEKDMLVHAVMGAGLPFDFGEEYETRGLAYLTRHENRYMWEEAKLAELPEGVLRAIYDRITS